MSNLFKKYKECLTNRDYFLSLGFSFLLLIFSLVYYVWALNYATEKASNSVTDIILSNIPVYDVADIFVYGILFFVAFSVYITLADPKRIPFVVKSIAMFAIFRSIFISLTHLGPYPNTFSINVYALNSLTDGGDMFFSGHTGLPFLMALVYWHKNNLRYLFIGLSVFFGTVALLGHYHYTIDVLAAFFITYGIYHICKRIFKKDYKLFMEGQ